VNWKWSRREREEGVCLADSECSTCMWSKLQKQKIIAPPYVNDPITGAFLYKKKKREMQTSKFTVNLTCNSYIDVITQ
jgi:hypothetical protein